MGELLDEQSPGRVDRWSRSYITSGVEYSLSITKKNKIMNNNTSNSIFGFVRTHFFKIMGVFLIIGLIQYACSDKEAVVEMSDTTSVQPIERVDN